MASACNSVRAPGPEPLQWSSFEAGCNRRFSDLAAHMVKVHRVEDWAQLQLYVTVGETYLFELACRNRDGRPPRVPAFQLLAPQGLPSKSLAEQGEKRMKDCTGKTVPVVRQGCPNVVGHVRRLGLIVDGHSRDPCQIRDNQTHTRRSDRVSGMRRGRARSKM